MKELDSQPVPYNFHIDGEAQAEQSKEDIPVREEVRSNDSHETYASQVVDQSLSDAWINMITEIHKAESKFSLREPFAAANNMYTAAFDKSENVNLQRGIAHVLNQEAQSIRDERESEELGNSTGK